MRIESRSDTSSLPSFSTKEKVESLSEIIASSSLSYEKELCQFLMEAINSSSQNPQIEILINRLQNHLLNEPQLDQLKLKEIITSIKSHCN